LQFGYCLVVCSVYVVFFAFMRWMSAAGWLAGVTISHYLVRVNPSG
jgi:hypothetical protein